MPPKYRNLKQKRTFHSQMVKGILTCQLHNFSLHQLESCISNEFVRQLGKQKIRNIQNLRCMYYLVDSKWEAAPKTLLKTQI